MTKDNGRVAEATGLSQVEPQEGLAPTGFDPSRGCEFCADPDGGEPWYPMYGVAPHECYWRKGAEFTIGQSTLLPFDQWEAGFVPELEDGETWADFKYPNACGAYYCPGCQREQYAAAWERFVAKFGPPPSDSDGSPKGGDACGSVHDSAGLQGIAPKVPS